MLYHEATYGGAVYLGIEPMTGMLLSRTSWRLYYETGIPLTLTKKILLVSPSEEHNLKPNKRYIKG